MSEEFYGKIALDDEDIKYLARGLSAILSELVESRSNAKQDDERSFYEAAHANASAIHLRMACMKPGRHPFSEEELGWLKTVLSASSSASLRNALIVSDDPQQREKIGHELRYRELLGNRLDQPFIADRSQDVEDDEDECVHPSC